MPEKQEMLAEWQRLMAQWKLACEDYASVRGRNSAIHGQTHVPIDETAIARARWKLIEVKQRIDDLISMCYSERAAASDPLQFVIIASMDQSPGKEGSASRKAGTPTLGDC